MAIVVNSDVFQCPNCNCNIQVGDGIIIKDCLHQFCKKCIVSHIHNTESLGVKCPDTSCESCLQDCEIYNLISSDDYNKHLARSSNEENIFRCKTLNCSGWILLAKNINEFHCPTCGYINCVVCCTIHEGHNCEQYQALVEFETDPESRASIEEGHSVSTGLRPIVIDGSNVAKEHGQGTSFSCRGIDLAVNYFVRKGHKVTVFVPQFRRHNVSDIRHPTVDGKLLDKLFQNNQLKYTPSGRVEGRTYMCYDDNFIVKLATTTGAVILSNDQYRDLKRKNPLFKEVIEKRTIGFTFGDDELMIPSDPKGKYGPTLEEFLSF